MTWLGFSAIGAAFLFFLIAPLVAFYFLKLKRPRLEIPSLILWRQVLNDHRVNSPFQRFKRNLLLLLQLLILVCLILAAMQPFWRSNDTDTRSLPILIDRSASMAALTERDGPTRFDLAKEHATSLIDALGTKDKLSLIAFGRTARQFTGFTNNKRVLHEALDKIKIEHAASDLTDALRMVEAMTRTAKFDQVLLLSDGNFPAQVNFKLPFSIDFRKLPAAGPNLGITAISAQRAGGNVWEVFVKVQGTEGVNFPARLELRQDGQPRGEEDIFLQNDREQRLIFSIGADQQTSLELRLTVDGFDSLGADNQAFLELSPLRPLRVHVSKSLLSYQHALRAHEQVDWNREGGVPAPGAFDLAITDVAIPPLNQPPTTLHVGMVPEDIQNLITVTKDSTAFVAWRRDSPLLEHIELGDVDSIDQLQWNEGVREQDLENHHYEVLAHGRHGPLILQKREGGKVAFFLLFHPDRSLLPYTVGFPIMTANLVTIAMKQADILEIRGDRAEVLPAMSLLPGNTYTIRGPRGFQREDNADADGVLSGVPAPWVGQYTVTRDDDVKKRVGVSLLRSQESSLAAFDRIDFEELSVTAGATSVKLNRPLWPLLTTIGLIVLLGEWWLFQRRPGKHV